MSVGVCLSRFRGCLIGALAGDCLGAEFEGKSFLSANQKKIDQFRETVVKWVIHHSTKSKDHLRYTDDTAMARDLSASLLERGKFDPIDMTKRFATTYFNGPSRGYGANIGVIFCQLQASNYEVDPVKVASTQFEGSGSFGNGAAMRVAAVPLFYANDLDATVELAKCQSMLTHTHPHGVMGAVLEAVSIYLALNSEPGSLEKRPADFLNQVQSTIQKYTSSIYSGNDNDISSWYSDRLNDCKTLLDKDASSLEVAQTLGTSVNSAYSVPAALYSFVTCIKEVAGLEINNNLMRTVAYAISLGGDTDTIATMAGAIAGAYYGDSMVPNNWYKVLEAASDVAQTAESLFQRHSNLT